MSGAVVWAALLLGLVVAGESAHVRLHPRRGMSPIASAAAAAFMLSLPHVDGVPRVVVLTIGLGTIGLAILAGALIARATGRMTSRLDIVGRLSNAFVAGCLGELLAATDLRESAVAENRQWVYALVLWLASLVAMSVRMLVIAAIASRSDQRTLQVTLRDEILTFGMISFATATTAAMIVLSRQAIGLWGPVFFMIPLLLSFAAARRYAQTRQTYRETIAALSRLTDHTGHTRQGHAQRVAELSVRLAHYRGLPQREIDTIEYAALLHDLGQVALDEPIDGGATLLIAPRDQERIADDGVAIIRHSGVLEDAAVVLSQQAIPFRRVLEYDERLPIEARIIRLANAFDDLTGGSTTHTDISLALERIQLGLGYEYDPELVDDLITVVHGTQRRSRSAPETAS